MPVLSFTGINIYNSLIVIDINNRMNLRREVLAAQFELIGPLLPLLRQGAERPKAPAFKVLNTILWLLINGAVRHLNWKCRKRKGAC